MMRVNSLALGVCKELSKLSSHDGPAAPDHEPPDPINWPFLMPQPLADLRCMDLARQSGVLAPAEGAMVQIGAHLP